MHRITPLVFQPLLALHAYFTLAAMKNGSCRTMPSFAPQELCQYPPSATGIINLMKQVKRFAIRSIAAIALANTEVPLPAWSVYIISDTLKCLNFEP
jgi:hypothetical protein